MGSIQTDRAEGTSSSDASGNPSAVCYPLSSSYQPFISDLAYQGFIDADTEEAAFMLQCVGMKHMRPYLRAAKKVESEEGPQVKDAHDLLALDRRFQAVVLKYIGVFEGQLRAQYSHWLDVHLGDLALYDVSNFLNIERYESAMWSLSREAKRSRDAAIRRCVRESPQDFQIPVRDAVECMTLGTLGKLFSNTADRSVTDTVSAFFGVTKTELSSWLKTITAVRNCCAHFDALLVRKEIPSTPIAITGLGADSRSVFYVVFLLGKLLSSKINFLDLNLRYSYRLWFDMREVLTPFFDIRLSLLRAVGVPENWGELLNVASAGAVHEGIAIYSELAG